MRKIIFCSLLLFFLGCWPFDPRVAESPAVSSEPVSAVTPSQLLEIIEKVYSGQLPVQYLDRILNPNFIFQSSPSDPTYSSSWDKSEEIRIATSMTNSFSVIGLSFTIIADIPDPVTPREGEIWITRLYHFSGSTNTGDKKIYSGKAELLLAYDATISEWQLKLWNDFKSDSLAPWGQLQLQMR